MSADQPRPEILQTVVRIVQYAISQKASDLHLVPRSAPFIRVGQNLKPAEMPPLSEKHTAAMIAAMIRPTDLKALQQDYSVNFIFDIPNLARIRGQAFRQMNGYAAILRIVPREIPTLRQLKFPPVIESMALSHRGIFVVSGPANSGKTTTMAALIHYINTYEANHIIIVEDPIEFVHENKKSLISQRQLGRDTNSYADSVVSALREDPDVILMGDMKDFESISAAITAAETGHFVISSIQSLGVVQTIERLIHFFPANQDAEIRNQLSLNLVGILSQVLLPAADGFGRVLAFELLPLFPALRTLIRDNKLNQIYSQMALAKKSNCITFKENIQGLRSKNQVDRTVADELLEFLES
jgi:twitching motility protein PilT